MFLVKSPRGDLLTKYHKEFEDMTGITVGSEMIPEQQQRQKAVIEFNSGNTSFDVIAISYHVQKRLFGKNKWMEDVRPLVADKSLTDPNLDFADFSKGGMAWATQPDGRIDSLPFNIDPWVIYYNKELFDAKNVAYPKSFPEIVDAAAKLNDPAKGVCGFVGRGLKNANVPVWSELPAGLRRHVRRCERQAHHRQRRGRRRSEDVPDAAREVADRRASPGSTGTRRRACSCKGRRRCGSTASASRSRSRIRPSRASSARSATA